MVKHTQKENNDTKNRLHNHSNTIKRCHPLSDDSLEIKKKILYWLKCSTHTDTHTHLDTDTVRQTDSQTNRHTCMHTHTHTHTHTECMCSTHTDTDRLTQDRQTERKKKPGSFSVLHSLLKKRKKRKKIFAQTTHINHNITRLLTYLHLT